MKKEHFIKELRKRLSVLEEKEINDIVTEYETIIDDKIKNGEDLQKAINDFGDIDELANEILKAYKINPDYNKKEEKIKADDFEDFVRKGANKLSEVSEKVVEEFKNNNISLEFIFEILIKAIILLILLAILRLPFMLITELGKSILDISIFPLNKVLIAIWYLLIWILYIVTCVFVGITLFRKNIGDKGISNKPVVKNSTKKETKKKDEIKEKVNVKEERPKKKENDSQFSDLLINIAKIFTYIFILIPLLFINLGLVFAIVFTAYYMFLGINCIGIVLVLIGCFLFLNMFYIAIKDLFNNKKHNYLLQIFLSVIFVAIGTILTVEWATSIKYIDNGKIQTSSYIYNIELNQNIELNHTYKTIIDNSLEDNVIRIDVDYYPEIYTINRYDDSKVINVDVNRNNISKIYNDIIMELKNNIVYDYNNLLDTKIKIYANENTIIKLKIND